MEWSSWKGSSSGVVDTFNWDLDRYLDALEIEGYGDIGSGMGDGFWDWRSTSMMG